MSKVWNVAIYARVSTDKKEQQESIPAQIQSLKKWLDEKGKIDKEAVYNLVEVYSDMGFSGSNFERESFQRMKKDIESGVINMILTRDLSRFSRNYIYAGYYLEDYFRVNGIRFISVLDNVDTLEEINDIIPFKNILNEMYIKDCSRRTRDGLKQRMLTGSSIASKPPYGYNFNEEYINNVKIIKLIPSLDETTDTVKLIFKLYIDGYGFAKIVSHLNNKGIAPPSAKLNFPNGKFGLWTSNSIKSILTNPKYGGMMVQNRWKKLSYKTKKIKVSSRDEWIYGGEFEGIIDKETFEEVQNLINKRSKTLRYKNGDIHLFSSVLKCRECGGSMTYRKSYEGYKCVNSQQGGGRCTSHSIKEEFLKAAIIQDMRKFIYEKIDTEALYNNVINRTDKIQSHDNELKKVEKELCKLDVQFEKLYMNMIDGVINKRNFELLTKSIQKRQENLLKNADELSKKLENQNVKETEHELLKYKLEKLLCFQDMDRQVIESIIDKIVVSESKVNKEKSIEIFYKFRG